MTCYTLKELKLHTMITGLTDMPLKEKKKFFFLLVLLRQAIFSSQMLVHGKTDTRPCT